MKFFTRTPAEQIAAVMRRVYDRGLTTASGGNISMLAENGDIWITPKGYDKGSLTAEDIVCVHPDGSYTGKHAPSSEIFFHRASYRARPDFRAVVHAHPVFCIAFSLTRTLPRVDLLPDTLSRCNNMQLSQYAMMGSPELGENMFAAFSTGADVVFLENHGVCVGGENLLAAYQLFETIEYAAKLDLLARKTGEARPVTGEQLALWNARTAPEAQLQQHAASEAENQMRTEMLQLLRRGCEHALLLGALGVCSARVDAQLVPDHAGGNGQRAAGSGRSCAGTRRYGAVGQTSRAGNPAPYGRSMRSTPGSTPCFPQRLSMLRRLQARERSWKQPPCRRASICCARCPSIR